MLRSIFSSSRQPRQLLLFRLNALHPPACPRLQDTQQDNFLTQLRRACDSLRGHPLRIFDAASALEVKHVGAAISRVSRPPGHQLEDGALGLASVHIMSPWLLLLQQLLLYLPLL